MILQEVGWLPLWEESRTRCAHFEARACTVPNTVREVLGTDFAPRNSQDCLQNPWGVPEAMLWDSQVALPPRRTDAPTTAVKESPGSSRANPKDEHKMQAHGTKMPVWNCYFSAPHPYWLHGPCTKSVSFVGLQEEAQAGSPGLFATAPRPRDANPCKSWLDHYSPPRSDSGFKSTADWKPEVPTGPRQRQTGQLTLH